MSKIGISSKIQRLLKESRLYCQSGRLEEAKLIYQDLLKSIPFHPEVLGNLGTIELKSGNTELGVKLLKQSISVDPTQCNFLSISLCS
jgi:tetratricopeptide (TPR) repeat protein